MKVEFIEPFAKAAFAVVEQVMNARPTRGQLAIRSSASTSQQLAVLLSVNGDVTGKILYGMSIVTAQKLASSMLGTAVMGFDELAQNTMIELGNNIVDHARVLLCDSGYICDFAAVEVVRAADLEIEVEKDVPTLVVPMLTQYGRIEIDIALTERCRVAKKIA